MTPLVVLLLGAVTAAPADLAPAWQALRAGDMAAARAAFEQALLTSPEEVEALNGMGFTALREGRTEDAGLYFERALAQSARDRDALVGQALVEERSGRPEAALKRVNAVLETSPADEEAKGLRTRLEAVVLSRKKAEQDHAVERRLAPARAARDAGRLEEGIRLYRDLVDDPDPAVQGAALEGLALLEAWRGDYGAAVTHYRVVRDRFPERRKGAVLGAARTLGWARRYTEALIELDQDLDEYPDDTAPILLEAQVAGWGGLTDRSLAAFRRVLEIDPEDRQAQVGLAKVLSWSGRLPESEVEFRTFLSKHPDDETGLMGMTFAVMWQGRPHEAEKWFGRLGPESEGSKDYRVVQTALLWALGERALARRNLRELMRQYPGEPDARDLWRAQSGVVGPFSRTEPTVLRDSEDLRVETLSLEGAAPLADSGFVFGEGRQEWLEQNGNALGVKGGRMGVDWVLGRRWRARGSLGVRRSDVDTGGWTGGGTLTTMLRPDRGFSAGVDSDFAFYAPAAVRSGVRMTGLTLSGWTALTSRLSVSAAYTRTHFAADEGSPRAEIDQHRDMLTVKARHYLLGFKTNRVDVGVLGYLFRFDRTFDAGYWNPRRFRQVMGTVAATHRRRGEVWTFIAEGGLGVQSQNDQPWRPAASGHGEILRQLSGRMDLTGRLSYGNSGLARRTESTGYWNWSAALGVQVRLGSRNPRGPVEDGNR